MPQSPHPDAIDHLDTLLRAVGQPSVGDVRGNERLVAAWLAMTERDWTPSDQADAADDERDRNWWKRNPYADPDYRANPDPSDEEEA